MNLLRTPTAGSAVSVVEQREQLPSFLEPQCAAAIWRRPIPTNVRDWLDKLDPDCLPHGRGVLAIDGVAAYLETLGESYGLPSGAERDWLYADIAALAQMFSELMSSSHLRLRLDVVTTNACRKFHVDAITARLVCTYRGTGTQYGHAQDGREPQTIKTVPTGAPILLRGQKWPPKPACGLLHRSPPIEGTGESRLVLVLDAVHDPVRELD